MANRTVALREMRDVMLHLTLFWVLIAIGIQFGFPNAARMWVILCTVFSVFLLLLGEVVLRFVPQK